MKTFLTNSPQETEQLAQRLAALLRQGDTVAYFGPMGAGKTTFTRGLAQGLGCPAEEVSSPTFSIVHEYQGKDVLLCHFDMYRIDGYEDLYSTGFFDYLDRGAVLAIEWSEQIEAFLPRQTIRVTFERMDGEQRKITVEGDDRFAHIGL